MYICDYMCIYVIICDYMCIYIYIICIIYIYTHMIGHESWDVMGQVIGVTSTHKVTPSSVLGEHAKQRHPESEPHTISSILCDLFAPNIKGFCQTLDVHHCQTGTSCSASRRTCCRCMLLSSPMASHDFLRAPLGS